MPRAAALNLDARIGQLFWIGFEGTTFNSALETLIRTIRPGGLILFGRNIESARQLRLLTDALYHALPIPPFLALDQEGGRVNRLRPILGSTPAAAMLASRADAPAAVARHATATALALKSLGFNVNFAPVLDLSGPADENGIGDRSYGEDPRRVADLAGRFIREHLRAGVVPVAKHFPGLGGARADTHQTLPLIRRSRALLSRRDLVPYRRLRGVVPAIMVGHGYYPAVQGRQPGPATLSHPIVTQLLRKQIGFRGLVLTDDLEMGAVDPVLDAAQATLSALQAGNDGIMFCRSEGKILRAFEAIRSALAEGRLETARVLVSVRRILALKRRYLLRRRGRYSVGSVARSRLLFESLDPGLVAGVDPTAR